MRKPRAVLTVLIGAAALAAVLPGAAHGYSISMSASPVVAEESAMTLTVSGTADAFTTIYLSRRPAGGPDCAAAFRADNPIDSISVQILAGPFSQAVDMTLRDAGPRLFCAWLQTHAEATTALARATPLVIDVRENPATIALSAPAVRAGETVQITGSVTTGLPREASIGVGPPVAQGDAARCGRAEYDALPGGFTFQHFAATGTTALSRSWQAPDRPASGGHYLVCGWVHEQYLDHVAEAQTAIWITVLPTAPCASAQQAVTERSRALKAAKRKAKRADGRRARRKAAKRVRSARKKLTSARNVVPSACD